MITTILQKAAKEAAEVIKSYYMQEVETTEKGNHHNIVTVADIEAQRVLKEMLVDLARSHGLPPEDTGFVAEEDGAANKAKTHTFIIDPIDGTSNFSSGLDYFAISLAYVREGVLQDALIYAPIRDTWYWAAKGKGAMKMHGGITTQLRVKKAELKKSLMLTSLSSRANGNGALSHIVSEISPKVKGLRVYGACSLDFALYAENQFAIVINGRAYAWDWAANQLILEEAGGTLYDWSGKPLTLNLEKPAQDYTLLACHSDHLPEIVPVLEKATDILNS